MCSKIVKFLYLLKTVSGLQLDVMFVSKWAKPTFKQTNVVCIVMSSLYYRADQDRGMERCLRVSSVLVFTRN